MNRRMIPFLTLISLLSISAFSSEWLSRPVTPDWSSDAKLGLGETRENIYGLDVSQLEEVKKEGYIHALKWPVKVTGLKIPYEPLKYFLEEEKKNPLKRLIEKIAEKKLGYNDMDGLYEWLGLNKFPESDVPDVFQIPYPDHVKPDYRVGASILDTKNGKAMTYSCATCHSGTFLGKTVMGLTNKRPRANEFFVMAKKYVPLIPSGFFRVATNATHAEKAMFKKTKENLKYVDAVAPQVLGLDTSLPHVSLSLAKRQDDEYATKKPRRTNRRQRRKQPKLKTFVADSKPMPWWNLKYKTRWLSDGSIVSGNPILTNFLWNELGRGTDLKELESWMRDNSDKIKEITAAAFATKAPGWSDFFPADSINLESAKRGEVVYNNSCKKCHGTYEKTWSLPNSEELTLAEKLTTTKVIYHEQTPVKDVGTDPNRWIATKEFSGALNKLAISKWMKTKVVPQKGYVPPPLEGVFLRYPYFHNNSIPNLCALMERPDRRPKVFVQGPSTKAEHFDEDCVGYPVGDKIPKEWWKEKDAIYRANKPGLLNIGHSKAFYDENGKSKMSQGQKKDLRSYLKTL
ncbi:hypothetical protein OAT67_02890 [Bacteriovoracaceae bacterium]|nr:hypothetical protein [Bacteriovoracaceae bacterium]